MAEEKSFLEKIKELLRQREEEIKFLKKTQVALKESKAVLEIRVAARTKELQELAERREEIVKERTKELRERLDELERFHKLTVGRELKMVELKNEIKKLKEELEKYKGREMNNK